MADIIKYLITPHCNLSCGETYCDQQKTDVVINALSRMNLTDINQVYTVNGQRYTLLEAAVLSALPRVVHFLLQLGANPLLSTRGVPLVTLIEPYSRNCSKMRVIYDMLYRLSPMSSSLLSYNLPRRFCRNCSPPRRDRRSRSRDRRRRSR